MVRRAYVRSGLPNRVSDNVISSPDLPNMNNLSFFLLEDLGGKIIKNTFLCNNRRPMGTFWLPMV
jgi:hypothetical protein